MGIATISSQMSLSTFRCQKFIMRKSIKSWLPLIVVSGWSALQGQVTAGVNYEELPIRYSATREVNSITRLQTRITNGEVKLAFEQPQGYLKSLLHELSIPVSSQALVFSKTSLQAEKISPKTPRAIFFNDEVHVAYVQGGSLEIAAADPQLGMVFYTLDQTEDEQPVLERQNNRCLNCHGAARTRNVPGLLVRSVFPDPKGQPVVAAGSFVSTHASPLEKRWGGWYVTGTHGDQQHLGNFTLPDARKPKLIENPTGQNQTDLSGHFDTMGYLSPHSDIVALMVLEHQTDGYTRFTQANFESRHALFARDQAGAPGTAAFQNAETEAFRRIDTAAETVSRFLLFDDEAKLTAPITGTSSFAREFTNRGQRDGGQPSLRELDLQTRMFKYPCSYLIESPAFRGLPDELRAAVYRRLIAALARDSTLASIQRFSPTERKMLLEILSTTVPDWPKS